MSEGLRFGQARPAQATSALQLLPQSVVESSTISQSVADKAQVEVFQQQIQSSSGLNRYFSSYVDEKIPLRLTDAQLDALYQTMNNLIGEEGVVCQQNGNFYWKGADAAGRRYEVLACENNVSVRIKQHYFGTAASIFIACLVVCFLVMFSSFSYTEWPIQMYFIYWPASIFISIQTWLFRFRRLDKSLRNHFSLAVDRIKEIPWVITHWPAE